MFVKYPAVPRRARSYQFQSSQFLDALKNCQRLGAKTDFHHAPFSALHSFVVDLLMFRKSISLRKSIA
jgi:hypothetical protein